MLGWLPAHKLQTSKTASWCGRAGPWHEAAGVGGGGHLSNQEEEEETHLAKEEEEAHHLSNQPDQAGPTTTGFWCGGWKNGQKKRKLQEVWNFLTWQLNWHRRRRPISPTNQARRGPLASGGWEKFTTYHTTPCGKFCYKACHGTVHQPLHQALGFWQNYSGETDRYTNLLSDLGPMKINLLKYTFSKFLNA